VNGRLFIKTVFDLQGNGVTFFPAKNGPRQASIDCFGLTLTARDIDGRFTNGQVKLSTLQGCGNWQAQTGTRIETPYAKTSGYAREVNPFRKVRRDVFNSMRIPLFKVWLLTEFENRFKLNYWFIHLQ
jgi:hypothetical protein